MIDVAPLMIVCRHSDLQSIASFRTAAMHFSNLLSILESQQETIKDSLLTLKLMSSQLVLILMQLKKLAVKTVVIIIGIAKVLSAESF